jgi:gamma-glutamyltranspeptidase / glutathione hydrolase
MFKKNFAAIILMAVFWTTQVYAAGHKVTIASANPLAAAAGFEILDKGGNVFDAVVAVLVYFNKLWLDFIEKKKGSNCPLT